MPIVIDGGRVPNLLSRKNRASSVRSIDEQDAQAGQLRIALINNMPDPALEDTEVQFYDLLDSAAGNIPISLKLYSLPGLPHGDSGTQHLANFYFGIEDLLSNRFDGVIVTGTEPRQPNLREEPYWTALTQVLDWAERNTASAVLSCLAAHAGVLHSDGIPRHRLDDKQFGVFNYKKVANHALTHGGGHIADSTFPLERSARRSAGFLWLRSACSISGCGRRLVCEKEKGQPVRSFSGSSRIWNSFFTQRIPKGHQEISQAGTRNISHNAVRLL